MQDRYAGDVGDYGKLGLLKALARVVRVGVNWYRVDRPDERTGDGRHIGYLYRPRSALLQCDPPLAHRLREIVEGGRSVRRLEGILEDLVHYSAVLSAAHRAQWHEDALAALGGCDLVFLDPDNGLLVPSVSRSSPRSVKYVFEEEIVGYHARGCSVLLYNHRSREPRERYRRRLMGLFENRAFGEATILVLTCSAYTVRDYLFILRPEHRPAVTAAVAAFLESPWKICFSEHK